MVYSLDRTFYHISAHPNDVSDEHGNRKLVGNTFDRTTDAAVPAMPAFFRIDYCRTMILHFKDVAGAILHTVSTSIALIHVDYRRHN